MELLKIFNEIDVQKRGYILREQLIDFQRKNGLSDFVERWSDMFDHNNDGKITYENFCNTIGLEPEEQYISQVNANREESAYEMDNVDIIKCDPNMTIEMQDQIITISNEAVSNYEQESHIAKHLKKNLDTNFGRVWHVVVGKSQFGSNISHIPDCFIHYKIEDYAFLVFKTPDAEEY